MEPRSFLPFQGASAGLLYEFREKKTRSDYHIQVCHFIRFSFILVLMLFPFSYIESDFYWIQGWSQWITIQSSLEHWTGSNHWGSLTPKPVLLNYIFKSCNFALFVWWFWSLNRINLMFATVSSPASFLMRSGTQSLW